MAQSSEIDRLEDRLCLMLHQASQAMTAAYRKVLTPLDLTYPQYTVLSALWRTDGVTIKQLGEVLGSDYSTMSPLIKRLEVKALVRRTRSSSDEREVLVRLTPGGRQLRGRAESVQADVRHAAGLSDSRRDRLSDELRALTERLYRYAG